MGTSMPPCFFDMLDDDDFDFDFDDEWDDDDAMVYYLRQMMLQGRMRRQRW